MIDIFTCLKRGAMSRRIFAGENEVALKNNGEKWKSLPPSIEHRKAAHIVTRAANSLGGRSPKYSNRRSRLIWLEIRLTTKKGCDAFCATCNPSHEKALQLNHISYFEIFCTWKIFGKRLSRLQISKETKTKWWDLWEHIIVKYYLGHKPARWYITSNVN